ncbi:hypothetical protein PUR57_14705 [Streptomyces sp. JV176]|uniref:hypothetical protein n=1 Tax=Streptomyces sp. JV176 TaxID=858630 RepID=UPI002E7A63F1|nr:hypothetical protein [Streptomyces sp. JV176]MEE1799905.1 hypothetical protein [Streptomyces sp. JV176]
MHSRDAHSSHDLGRARGHAAGDRPLARTGGPESPMHSLQNSMGNRSVVRAMSAQETGDRQQAGPVTPLQRAMGSAQTHTHTHTHTQAQTQPVQRAELKNTPVGEAGGFGGALDADDVRLLGEAAGRVHEIMEKAQGAGKEVLLYIGVGTGNPAAAWGNPTSGGTGGITEADQQSPGFLAEAGAAGYTVIAVNFNVGEGKAISETGGDGPVVKMSVPARFPLDADGKKAAEGPVGALHAAAGAASRFAIMNAVTQADYQPLIDLATAKKQGQSAYLKSYMQDGKTSAFSPMNKKKGMYSEGGKFGSMGDVFAADKQD